MAKHEQAAAERDELGYREAPPDAVEAAGEAHEPGDGDEHYELAGDAYVKAIHPEAEGLAGARADYAHARERLN